MPTLQQALRDAGLSDAQRSDTARTHAYTQAPAHVSPPWAPASTIGRVQHARRYEPTVPFRMDRHLTTLDEFTHTQELVCPYDPHAALARHILVARGERESVRTHIAMDDTGRICPTCHMQIAPAFDTCPDC